MFYRMDRLRKTDADPMTGRIVFREWSDFANSFAAELDWKQQRLRSSNINIW